MFTGLFFPSFDFRFLAGSTVRAGAGGPSGGAPLRTIKKETETFVLPPDHHRRPARGSLPKGPGYLPHKCIGPRRPSPSTVRPCRGASFQLGSSRGLMLIHDRTPVLTPFPGFACLFRFIYLLCRYLVSFLLSWLLYGCMWIFLSRLYNLRAHCFRRFWQKRRGRGAREAAGKSVLTIWTTLTTSGDVSILNAEPCASFTPGAGNSRGGPNVPPPRTGSAARLRLLCGAPALLNLRVGTSTEPRPSVQASTPPAAVAITVGLRSHYQTPERITTHS